MTSLPYRFGFNSLHPLFSSDTIGKIFLGILLKFLWAASLGKDYSRPLSYI